MPLYRNLVSTEVSTNNKKTVLLIVLLYCYSSTVPGYAPDVEPSDSSEPSLSASVADTVAPALSSGVCAQGEPEVLDRRQKKRKYTTQTTFTNQIKLLTGLDLLPAEDKNGRRCSLCKTCGTVTVLNQTVRWKRHAQSYIGLKASIAPLSAEAQRLVVQCTA
jgi:hypothetical protein